MEKQYGQKNINQVMADVVFQLDITDITKDGKGVGHWEGMAVFVTGALPGERILARITAKKKRYALGETVEILSPSPQRVVSSCPERDRCGGCSFSHLDYAGQQKAKAGHIQEEMGRIGGVTEVAPLPLLAAEEQWAYRNRIYLHYEGGQLGFFSSGGKKIVSISHCRLATAGINQILAYLQQQKEKLAGISGLKHILIKESNVEQKCMVVFLCEGKKDPKILEKTAFLQESSLAIASLWYNYGKKTLWDGYFFTQWQHLQGEEKLPVRLMGREFLWGARDFLQVNFRQTEVLYGAAKQLLQSIDMPVSYLWDIYCGIGTIGIGLAEKDMGVVGIELVPEAVKSAGENSRSNGIPAYYFAGAAETLLPALLGAEPPKHLGREGDLLYKELKKQQAIKTSVAILDPPRLGCEEPVLAACAQAGFPYIIYISCHGATLARDVKYLKEHGYRVRSFQPIDLFPQTGHCECICFLEHSPR